LSVNHPGILAGKREELEFATTAEFLRFPNKNPENATLAENSGATGHPKCNAQRKGHLRHVHLFGFK